jgi:hypothetical protein
VPTRIEAGSCHIQLIFALDRIALHNTNFPETRLTVLGFGRDSRDEFKIIAEHPT